MTVLLDTNILLDVIQRRDPHHRAADRVWALIELRQLEGFVSAISFNNLFYVARKSLGPARSLDALRDLRRLFQVVPLDGQLIDHAIASATTDLEDAIQAAAAIRIGAQYVVTRNVGDFGSFGVRAVTAEQLLAIILTHEPSADQPR